MNIQRFYPLIFLLASPVIASDTDPEPYLQTAASYRIYGGELGDPTAPRPNDKKVVFSIEGNAARQIFDAIGPDQRDPCTEGSGMRVRHKDREHLTCTLSKKNEYACNFGFDLVSGKSIGGSICRRPLPKTQAKKNGTPQGAVSLSTQTITRRRRAAQPKPKQLAGLPSLAARRPYWPSLAGAVPDALPLPTLPSLCERGGMLDPYRSESGSRPP